MEELIDKAQYLPMEANTTIGEQVVNLEVTRNNDEQSKGLMFREALPDDRGMLFNFNPPDTLRFWMKNVSSFHFAFLISDRSPGTKLLDTIDIS